jgi:hypothetical protein
MTLIIAVAALILAAAALALAIIVMRQNATTVTDVRKLRRTVKLTSERVADLLAWSTDVHEVVFPDQELADPLSPEQADEGTEQPQGIVVVDGTGATIATHPERPDLPTTAMPAQDRPEVRP